MQIPGFELSWPDFISEWCLDVTPAQDAQAVASALEVLMRLWPDYAINIIHGSSRGIIFVVPIIEMGMVLAACERFIGFDHVLYRAQRGERAAISELSFAAALASLGYIPAFGPSLNGKQLDLLFQRQGIDIYVEIVTPETSDAQQMTNKQMIDLASLAAKQNQGMHTEFFLLTDITEDVRDSLLTFARQVNPSESTHDLPGIALISKQELRPGIEAKPLITDRSDPSHTTLFVTHASIGEGVSTRATVRLPVKDDRAQRIFTSESHHFSTHTHNLLVIDVSSIPNGIRQWTPLITRRYQPSRNRRFSATVLLSQAISMVPAQIQRQVAIISNPYAHNPLPPDFLGELLTLESQPNNEV